MLLAKPLSLLSTRYRVFEDGRPVAVIETSRMREAGRLILEEAAYSVYREGVFFGRYVLENEDGEVLATAEKPGLFARRFEVEHDGSTTVLRAASLFRRPFVLTEHGEEVGRIHPVRLLSRSALADLPEAWLPAVRLFMLWLVLLLWRRDSGGVGGGG